VNAFAAPPNNVILSVQTIGQAPYNNLGWVAVSSSVLKFVRGLNVSKEELSMAAFNSPYVIDSPMIPAGVKTFLYTYAGVDSKHFQGQATWSMVQNSISSADDGIQSPLMCSFGLSGAGAHMLCIKEYYSPQSLAYIDPAGAGSSSLVTYTEFSARGFYLLSNGLSYTWIQTLYDFSY
jgi:hypothetical protein